MARWPWGASAHRVICEAVFGPRPGALLLYYGEPPPWPGWSTTASPTSRTRTGSAPRPSPWPRREGPSASQTTTSSSTSSARSRRKRQSWYSATWAPTRRASRFKTKIEELDQEAAGHLHRPPLPLGGDEGRAAAARHPRRPRRGRVLEHADVLHVQGAAPPESSYLALFGAVTDYLDSSPLAGKMMERFDRQFVLLESTLLSYAISNQGREPVPRGRWSGPSRGWRSPTPSGASASTP